MAESLLPSKEFDNPDVLKNLVGAVDTLIGLRHNLLLDFVEAVGNEVVDWEQ